MIEEYRGKDISQMFGPHSSIEAVQSSLQWSVMRNHPRNGFTAASLLQIFDEAFQTFWEPGTTFQQDNAPIHKARSVQNWLHEHDIKSMDWPRYSPDLNPIEYL